MDEIILKMRYFPTPNLSYFFQKFKGCSEEVEKTQKLWLDKKTGVTTNFRPNAEPAEEQPCATKLTIVD